MLLVWDENAWQDYLWWQEQDRRTLKRINTLLADIQRNGNAGIGKPPEVAPPGVDVRRMSRTPPNRRDRSV